MTQQDGALAHVRTHRAEHLEQLKQLVSIPSISTLPEYKGEVGRTAEWVAAELRRIGMTRVDIIATPGHPIVYAEWRGAPGRPTVLVYGHYDVQPVDPVSEWVSGPFDATVRGDNLYGRGASDMKGQILANLKAVEALAQQGPLPVNIKYVIEGEEEIGSLHLGDFIDSRREALRCDVVLNCDAGIHRPDQPAIVYALRGLAYFELEVRSPKQDLHSGLFGGSIRNPAQVLCELIAGMHDADGRVTLPGFYEKVQPLDDEERQVLAQVPHSDEEWREMTGVSALWGEKGYTTVERVGARPTLEINGLISGFTGEGSKTVLPAKALAKLSTRLVPNQDPGQVCGQLSEYLRRHAPEGVTWEVRELVHGAPAVVKRDSPAMRAAASALKEVFGVEPIFKREGGSVPVVGLLQQKLGVDSIMLGFALPDDGIHGPNEKQHLPSFYRGIETYIRFLTAL
ncbi:MAG: dipeptidase [Candidatus Hydrogenedentes bacterium]|nr:dipeptidase [Candidatus Hydrogenedentota bacterium]